MNPTYTPTTGNTPQGQQVAQQSASLNAAASNGGPPPQAAPPTSMGMNPQQVAQGYMGAQQGVVALNTPDQRQQTLNDTTNLAGQQVNYDNLAQQLAKYDTGVLQPQFQGTNPGMPSDLPNNPYVTFGNVSYATPGSTSQPITGPLYNANPSYALTAQANAGNNIADLMSALNNTMSTGLQQGKDVYGGKLSSASTILKGWSDLMNMVQQDQANKADLAYKYAALGQSNKDKDAAKKQADESKLFSFAQQIKDDFNAGHYSLGNPQLAWGKAWQELSTLRNQVAPGVSDDELNAFLGGQATRDTSGNWTGTGNASADTLQQLGQVAYKKLPTAPTPSALDSIMGFLGLGGQSNGGVHLYDPTTNQTFNYPSTTDPDYSTDLQKGFIPQ